MGRARKERITMDLREKFGVNKNLYKEDNFINLIHIREGAFNAAAEAIQICAVIDKWLGSGKI